MQERLFSKRIKGYRPITYFENGLILARGADLFFSDLQFSKIKHILKLPIYSKFKNKLSYINCTSRLLRLNSSFGLIINNKNLLIKTKAGVFLCDLKNKNVLRENVDILGNPFYLLKSALRNTVLIGDYSYNIEKKRCSIYERSQKGNWSTLYSFPRGTINHIHAIYEDLENNCFYILTGDFGKSSSIWKADCNFENVNIHSHHGQSTRACWLMQDKDYLYYVSDRQDKINYFYRLEKNAKSNPIPYPLFPVNGPSINMSACSNSNYVFSTVVEPISVERNTFTTLFDSQLPPGVLSKNIFVYYGSPKNGFQIIYQTVKDFLPPRLFQFGDIYFPTGVNQSNFLHFYEQSSKKYGISSVALGL